ncbi:helix-turn-helix domain-containing protein [Rhodobacteraceae bacterium NNCM2]|nr:helix-turn-helix domain-containing protein [Coraliihabitans acroporae]
MASDQQQKPVPAVQNAVLILRLLASRREPMGATQISRETGLNVSSAFNILRTLTNEGLLSFDPASKTYRIGMGMMEFATPLLGANPSDLLRPMMNEIAEEHQVMIALWQITRTGRIVLIDRFTAERIVQAVIAQNSRLPVFAGAVGRCFAAKLDLSEAETRAGFETVRWQSDPGFDAYWSDVQEAKRTGSAKDHGNLFRGLEIVAAIASDIEGTPRIGMSSITISGQHDGPSLDAVGRALADAAIQIERCVFGVKNTPQDT